ncbi:MAG: hydrogenase expression protein, partial [Synergistales bacterium]|nr:hydrogenase expression protein [Synergistales bacterium]
SVIAWEKGGYLVASSDPVVGAQVGAGGLLVHINANDVAAKGAEPAYFLLTLILPSSCGEAAVERLMEEIHGTCRELGIAIVGGHTEFTDRYEAPVLSGTLFGRAERCLRAEDIGAGDVLIMTKHAGLEGMSILAQDRPDLLRGLFGEDELRRLRGWSGELSILPEARLLRPYASFMHDPTEGGLLGGVAEIAWLLGELRLTVDEAGVPVDGLTARAAERLSFNPLQLISSGVLLAVVPRRKEAPALEALEQAGIPWARIGAVAPQSGGVSQSPPKAMHEELWRLLAMPRGKE